MKFDSIEYNYEERVNRLREENMRLKKRLNS